MTTLSATKKIAISGIVANPNQPRKLFDQMALADLASSIKQNGLLQPITVAPAFLIDAGEIVIATGATGDYKKSKKIYVIVAGERRWRATKLAGLDSIECIVKNMNAEEVATSAIIENLQRVNVTPMEEAQAYQAMLDEGYANDEKGKPSIKILAKKLGINQPFRIAERIALLNMIDGARAALTDGRIGANAAWYISHLQDVRKQRMLLDACLAGKCDNLTRLKATNDAIAMQNLDEEVTVLGMDLRILDPAIQAKINAIQATIDNAAAAIAALIIEEKVAEVANYIGPGQAEKMAQTLNNLGTTTKQVQVQLYKRLAIAS